MEALEWARPGHPVPTKASLPASLPSSCRWDQTKGLEKKTKWKVAQQPSVLTVWAEAGHLHVRPRDASASANPIGYRGTALGSVLWDIWSGLRLWGVWEERWKGSEEIQASLQLNGRTRSSQLRKLEALNAFSSIPEVRSCARRQSWAQLWSLLPHVGTAFLR